MAAVCIMDCDVCHKIIDEEKSVQLDMSSRGYRRKNGDPEQMAMRVNILTVKLDLCEPCHAELTGKAAELGAVNPGAREAQLDARVRKALRVK